jgi:hypothetical protein
VVVLTAVERVSADSLETNYVFAQAVDKAILSEAALGVAETNCRNMLLQYSNSPQYLGKLHMAMAERYTFVPERDGIIKECEAALRCPLVYNDVCHAWALTGVAIEPMQDEVPVRELPAFRRRVLAAYLNGLKAAGGDIPLAGMFKGYVARFYANNPYYQEILTEGINTFTNAAVLEELVERVEKSNHLPLPPATENQPPVGSVRFDSKEYEVEGVIEEDIFGSFPGKLKAEFHVWVKGSAWLIETTELVRTRGSLRSERAGTANSTEIYTLNVPINRVIEAGPTNPPPAPVHRPPGGLRSLPVGTPINILASTGKVVSNTMPLADDDEAIVPHLWLMFASHGCFQDLGTNRLTPVYEYYAPEKGKSPLKLETVRELMSGSGALPLRVNYYTDGGLHEGYLQAAYRVTGITNFGGTVFPAGFLFEQYAPTGGTSRYDMKVVRRAEAKVTAFRPVCSIKKFLPECDTGVFVTDWRPANAQTSNTPVRYHQRDGVKWLSAAEAKRRSEGKGAPRMPSPILLVVFGALLVPPVVLMLKSVKRKSLPSMGR